MPIGVLVNVMAVILGGLLGSRFGDRMSEKLKREMTTTFGLCAMAMGISAIVLMKDMPAVIFAVIVGVLIGTLLDLDGHIRSGASHLMRGVNSGSDMELMVTAIVLFCASGTGIYGSMTSGMTGDHSILLSKSTGLLYRHDLCLPAKEGGHVDRDPAACHHADPLFLGLPDPAAHK